MCRERFLWFYNSEHSYCYRWINFHKFKAKTENGKNLITRPEATKTSKTSAGVENIFAVYNCHNYLSSKQRSERLERVRSGFIYCVRLVVSVRKSAEGNNFQTTTNLLSCVFFLCCCFSFVLWTKARRRQNEVIKTKAFLSQDKNQESSRWCTAMKWRQQVFLMATIK